MFVNKQSMVGSLATLFLLVTLSLSLYCHGETLISAEEEDVELEKKLQILNKPPIKTFQDGPNDIIDCIDINKQPAFDHPLLKNHRIQMKPTFPSKDLMDKRSSTSKHRILSVKSFECPQGTVPIRRTRKEELVQAKYFHQFYHRNPNQQTDLPTGGLPGRHVARVVAGQPTIVSKTYTGVEGYLNLQNPDVNGDQWSSVQLWVEETSSVHSSTIQAGWAVSPKFLGDEKTRFYIRWEVSETGKPLQGCLNLQCPGFVQVDQSHPIGIMFFPNISAYGGILYEVPLSIQQDNITRHWWLRGIKDPNNPINFGYWPNSLFPNLPSVGPQVAWGGMVMGTDTNGASPPMGNGYFPNNDFTTSCYVTFVQVSFTESQTGNLVKDHPYTYDSDNDVDSSKCYNLVNYPDSPPETGWATMFGGPGGSNC